MNIRQKHSYLYGIDTPLTMIYDECNNMYSNGLNNSSIKIGKITANTSTWSISPKYLYTLAYYLKNNTVPESYTELIEITESFELPKKEHRYSSTHSGMIIDYFSIFQTIVDVIPECMFIYNNNIIAGRNWRFVILVQMRNKVDHRYNFFLDIPTISQTQFTEWVKYACINQNIPFNNSEEIGKLYYNLQSDLAPDANRHIDNYIDINKLTTLIINKQIDNSIWEDIKIQLLEEFSKHRADWIIDLFKEKLQLSQCFT